MVKHILKNESSPKSVDGQVIKNPEIYQIIRKINERKKHEKK